MGVKAKEDLERQWNGNANGYDSLQIKRPVYQIEELHRDTQYEKPRKSFRTSCKNAFESVSCTSCLLNTVPILKWLPEYSWKNSFVSDIISGITVAIMHIPQGMAYGLLGGVPPVVGIYMAFFPVLVYTIFGTSRHVSMGTFAIVCLMTGKVVSQYTTIEHQQNGTIARLTQLDELHTTDYNNIQVASTVTFVVAMIQLVMYVMRLGLVSTLLSATLVDGFTTAAAFHVASSQLKDMFGIPIPKRRGNFSFIMTIYDAVLALPKANPSACLVSFITSSCLILNNEVLKGWLAKKTRIPFPIELAAVVLGTTASYLLSFETNYNISVVGHIPTGFPNPQLPAFDLIPNILLDCFVITMVSYTVTMSMALTFSRKLMYEVDSNQELLALGLSNSVGSFFSCMPITASLSRSMIQQTVGGVTQIASVVSCSILLCILLWIGPFFELLPRCVLTSIIIVSLKGILFKITMIKKYWRLSKWDALVWIVTFGTTLILQISYGLAAGIVVSLLSIFIQGYTPYSCLLGVIPDTDLYLDIKRYKTAVEIEGVKIFHFSGGLNFASRAVFKEVLNRKIGFDAQEVLRKRSKLRGHGLEDDDDLLTKYIILDFSAISYVDPSGVEFLRQLKSDYGKLGVEMFIVGCSGPVYEVIKRCDRMEKVESGFVIFPTIHDAVLYASTASTINGKDR
ncbi:prestin-like isoform X2 [Aethina tumida]|uniref:prestin-like isoform X2 n=1 Tax=Aethina tumida TaxID=116153 RepID=UPI0021483CDB|nr:prestin-like isoform X2 [Aethina tumida]XP_049825235.1 prestin-like isoform X2 [Aethina tumida]